ncbi:MAG: insulinase family protein [Bacteroidales bacterium]|nr:insulinase family protein [Bacteroidales bacterium]
MINFRRYNLDNGLKLIVHQDRTTPLLAVNILYDVGARDEHPEHTGFAHLFEHLMFEGSANIPEYDNALQMAGGENNAFTTNDITNYYLTIPKQNIETALWLESDRMLELAFSEDKLNIQKDVVSEEYRQSYLNQPYGDVWALLRSLVYKVHPYQWPTIGKSIDHVKNATLVQVKDFFYKFYRPNNAIIVLTGDIDPDLAYDLVKKWFGDIPAGKGYKRNLPAEPMQTAERRLTVERDVPFDEIYMAFPTGIRLDHSFYTTDLLTDLLAGGSSARLRENLVKKKNIFSEANAWVTGSIDNGFLAVMGKLHKNQTVENAETAIWEELRDLKTNPVSERELQKVKNKLEASNTFAEAGILSKAMNLAYYELLEDADFLNHQTEKYFAIDAAELQDAANDIFKPNKANVLHYLAKK